MAHFRHSYVIFFTSILLPAALIFQPAKASVASDSTTGISAGSNTTDSAATAAAADSAAIIAAADSATLDSLIAEFDRKEVKLGEVVVTAREATGPATASLIDRQAMAHLQPSSFSDLIELLPGFVSKDPQMGEANLIALRQAPQAISGDNYSTSSLGTSFLVDGVPINTSSQLQTTSDSSRSARLTAGKGVDMRAISTDDIESVEIVRGIPSAEYGDLTSGLVKIKRKSSPSGIEARFKADMQSQLLYVGKGFAMPAPDWNINLSASYLNSRIDPRNNRDNFKRVTFSARSNLRRQTSRGKLTWDTSLNYTGTFERDKHDPDLTVNNTIDFYTNDVNTLSWNNSLVLLRPSGSFLNSLSLTTGLSMSYEHLRQEKTVTPPTVYPLPVSVIAGPNYVGYLPMLYLADYNVYGKPLTLFLKPAARFRYNTGRFSGFLKAGAEYNYSKNFGRGAVYDLTRPLTAGNTARPRAFSDIPAIQQLSFYAEAQTDISLGQSTLHLQAGLRETQMPGISRDYYLSWRPFLDPRANLRFTFPALFVSSYPLTFELGGGVGLHTKMPVAASLYPDRLFNDYVQLNYYHNVPEYRTMNVMTCIDDRVNFDLRPARNLKWEIRADVNYRGNNFSITYFREHTDDAFRMASEVRFHTYNRYDPSGWNPSVDGAPAIDKLSFTPETIIQMVSRPTNASLIDKKGVEFTFSSRRIPMIRTRVTVNGAWFHTRLTNSDGLWYKPSTIVNGKELYYAGYYDDPDGSVYQSINTNFTFDTDVPRLGLNVSLTVQNMWFTSTRQLPRSGMPTQYIGIDGEIHPWTGADAENPYLQQLIRRYSSTAFDVREVPVATQFNIKATKRFWRDRIGLALYVNRLISITPDYMQYGIVQRRYSSPYFGMEMNLKI